MLKNFRLILKVSRSKFSTNVQDATSGITDAINCAQIETKLLKVAIIGVPNAGKSTLINNLIDRHVCPTSSKVHTTRAKSMAIFTEGDSQIVFLDTPGLVNFKEHQKYNLERSFLKDCRSSLQQADIIGVIHDTSNIWTREKLDIKVINLLEEHYYKPSFLVFNKVDMLKSKRKLLDLTRIITENCVNGKPIASGKPIKLDKDVKGWPNFEEVFMVSALTGTGLPEVKNYLIRNAKPDNWMFPAEVWSDQTAEQIIVNSVKAKLLDYLPQEIPYQLKPEMEFFNINDKGIISTVVLVQCRNQRIKRLIEGVSDGKLHQITESLQTDLQNTFQNFVRIRLIIEAPQED